MTSIQSSDKQFSKSAFLFFHGFPGSHNANIDLARAVHQLNGDDIYLIHYPGMYGSSGSFGFIEAIRSGQDFFRKLTGHYSKISLVGHSWGGTVAMSAALQSSAEIGELILLAPFNKIPEREVVRQVLKDFSKNVGGIRGFSVEKSLDELGSFRGFDRPIFSLETKGIKCKRILIVQGRSDEEVSYKDSRLLAEYMHQSFYVEIHDDHSFSNRRQLLSIVSDWLRRIDLQ